MEAEDRWAAGYRTEWWKGGRTKLRVDFMGWMDCMGITAEHNHFVGVQASSRAHKSNHLRKIANDPTTLRNLTLWLTCPDHFAELWLFDKVKGRERVERLDLLPLVLSVA